MAKPDTLIVDGHAYSWQRLCELRRQQLEAWRLSQLEQPALFALKADCRPATERTAADRHREPTLFAVAVRPRLILNGPSGHSREALK
jgi:hypothetical protein